VKRRGASLCAITLFSKTIHTTACTTQNEQKLERRRSKQIQKYGITMHAYYKYKETRGLGLGRVRGRVRARG
jgi:hypothetical protein